MKNAQAIHIPERLPDESFDAYKVRRKLSQQIAKRIERGTLTTLKPQQPWRTARRKLVRQLGIRQFKRKLRSMKGACHHG